MKKSSIISQFSGVSIFELERFEDSRGWLAELYRSDQLEFMPQMAYISMTSPGITRGPHQHCRQTDLFFFIGPGDFKLHLWDYKWTCHESHTAGTSKPLAIIVPPSIIHAYKNISKVDGIVFNAPDALYSGKGKLYPVDERRWEESTEFAEWLKTCSLDE